MARYTGPKTKIARKFGEAIFGDDKSFEKRNFPPGQHGNARRRGKKSEYAVQLMEKQKAKYTYGILEKQFRNIFASAKRKEGVTGEILLQLCECRLAGDVVGVREKSKSISTIQDSLAANSSVYEWITWNTEKMEGNFVAVPERLQIPENIKEQLIVELYSK